LSLIRTKNT